LGKECFQGRPTATSGGRVRRADTPERRPSDADPVWCHSADAARWGRSGGGPPRAGHHRRPPARPEQQGRGLGRTSSMVLWRGGWATVSGRRHHDAPRRAAQVGRVAGAGYPRTPSTRACHGWSAALDGGKPDRGRHGDAMRHPDGDGWTDNNPTTVFQGPQRSRRPTWGTVYAHGTQSSEPGGVPGPGRVSSGSVGGGGGGGAPANDEALILQERWVSAAPGGGGGSPPPRSLAAKPPRGVPTACGAATPAVATPSPPPSVARS